tara:strand:- start:612 stop:971 length:360 start_codon:yes stop_codon:yes gene_type:complete
MIGSDKELTAILLARPWTFGEIMRLDATLEELIDNYDFSLEYLVKATDSYKQLRDDFKHEFIREIKPIILEHLEKATVVMKEKEVVEVASSIKEQFEEGMKTLTKEELKEQIKKDTKQV